MAKENPATVVVDWRLLVQMEFNRERENRT